ncbi:hypothetical protein EDC18_11151 [Natranaerovirga pectinivora]|uniref:Lipoprotein n=1 Tax=Natranaerovirga pectinivora TaxID=682400 RepID=A0A4R3MGV7_9FIRM|nr:hypothetical protein [Natranaerovirga pectinivora]TCT12880.1 hypothetical protein EDC18_11151 [Natranaerovirga pectinivora]
MRNTISILCFMAIILVGCTDKNINEYKQEDLIVTQIKIENANKDLSEFINKVEKENGTYLYTKVNDQDTYLFLNNSNVIYGDNVTYYTDIKIEGRENTIYIYFNEEITSDYSGIIPNQLLYKIEKKKTYDYVKMFKNGEESYFSSVIIADNK